MIRKDLKTNGLSDGSYCSPSARAVVLQTRSRILGNSLHGNTPGIEEDDNGEGFSDF